MDKKIMCRSPPSFYCLTHAKNHTISLNIIALLYAFFSLIDSTPYQRRLTDSEIVYKNVQWSTSSSLDMKKYRFHIHTRFRSDQPRYGTAHRCSFIRTTVERDDDGRKKNTEIPSRPSAISKVEVFGVLYYSF